MKGAINSFLGSYNVIKKGNEMYIDKRIKNYASILNIPIEGVVHKGVVVRIFPDDQIKL